MTRMEVRVAFHCRIHNVAISNNVGTTFSFAISILALYALWCKGHFSHGSRSKMVGQILQNVVQHCILNHNTSQCENNSPAAKYTFLRNGFHKNHRNTKRNAVMKR